MFKALLIITLSTGNGQWVSSVTPMPSVEVCNNAKRSILTEMANYSKNEGDHYIRCTPLEIIE